MLHVWSFCSLSRVSVVLVFMCCTREVMGASGALAAVFQFSDLRKPPRQKKKGGGLMSRLGFSGSSMNSKGQDAGKEGQGGKEGQTAGSGGGGQGNSGAQNVPTTYPEMFSFNAAIPAWEKSKAMIIFSAAIPACEKSKQLAVEAAASPDGLPRVCCLCA